MASPVIVRIKNEPEFQATLKQYAKINRRTFKEITDSKALFIARGALWNTKKASKEGVKRELLELAYTLKTSASGRTRKYLKQSASRNAPVAALLINWKRGRRGEPGLYGDAMKKAVKNFLASRLRSIAFLKSGWIPAIRILNPLVKSKSGAKPIDRTVKQYGKDKGTALPAREGSKPKTIIENSASAKDDKKDALFLYGEPALKRAFADETQSMLTYMADKLKGAAREAGIRTG